MEQGALQPRACRRHQRQLLLSLSTRRAVATLAGVEAAEVGMGAERQCIRRKIDALHVTLQAERCVCVRACACVSTAGSVLDFNGAIEKHARKGDEGPPGGYDVWPDRLKEYGVQIVTLTDGHNPGLTVAGHSSAQQRRGRCIALAALVAHELTGRPVHAGARNGRWALTSLAAWRPRPRRGPRQSPPRRAAQRLPQGPTSRCTTGAKRSRNGKGNWLKPTRATRLNG